MEDARRIEAALAAVQGIPTGALEADVVGALVRACERIVAAVEDVGGTGDAGIDGAAEAAYRALQKMHEED